jgi:CBS domain-containing protein
MRCEDLMKHDVECTSPQDTVQSAARKMRDENVGFLPVCDASGKVLGTVTDRDLAIRVLPEALGANTKIGDVMTHQVVACRPEDDLRNAEDLMIRNQKSRIMCIDAGGKLVGVISLSDIFQREDANRAAQTMRAVTEREVRA